MMTSLTQRLHREHITDVFMGELDRLRPNTIAPFELVEFTGADEALGDARTLQDFLPNEGGLYVDVMYADIAQRACRAEFTTQETLAIGREDSRNSVFFGTLALRSFRPSDPLLATNIAVKPFAENDGGKFLAKELYMTSVLHSRGLDTINTIGVLRTPDVSFLLSKFKPEAITLDSIDWLNLDPITSKQVTDKAVFDLVQLHQHRLIHGDALPRNLTLQPDVQRTWYVDLEYGAHVDSVYKLHMGIKSDLTRLYEGLCILQGKPQSFKDFVATVFEPYEQSIILLLNDSATTESAREGLTTISRLLKLLGKEFNRHISGDPMTADERQFHFEALNFGPIFASAFAG